MIYNLVAGRRCSNTIQLKKKIVLKNNAQFSQIFYYYYHCHNFFKMDISNSTSKDSIENSENTSDDDLALKFIETFKNDSDQDDEDEDLLQTLSAVQLNRKQYEKACK